MRRLRKLTIGALRVTTALIKAVLPHRTQSQAQVTPPEPPQGVRMVLPDGTQIPLAARYEREENGMHRWKAVLVDVEDAVKVWGCTSPDGVKVTADVLPGRTSIAVEMPPMPPGTNMLMRGSYRDHRGKPHHIDPVRHSLD